MSHSFLFLCTLISYLTNVKTNKFVQFFYFSTNLTNDSVVGEQLCWKRNDTTKFSEKCSTQEAQPPSGTADPLLGGKVDHLRPAWTGPLLPLKFLTLATLMPGCPDKYKHLVRDSSMYEKPGATNTKLRQNPKTVSSKTSFLVEASPVTLEGGHSERNRLSWTLTSPPMICACTCKLTWFCRDFLTPLTSLFISCHQSLSSPWRVTHCD